MALAVCVPLLIVAAVFPSNWVAALILLGTAPLIPLFMAMVGMGAADANRRNFQALARLSGHFLDRLRGMETLRIFGRGEAETESIRAASQDFRQRTMEVLRPAFLSSGVLEFFTSLSIALVAVYFGFSYLGELDFGHYGTGVTLAAGFLALILAPEFFQPLRDLGTFYHAKAQAVGAADSLKTFMETPLAHPERGDIELATKDAVSIEAHDLIITSPEGKVLAGPLNFTTAAGQRAVLVGRSGSGKSSLLNVLSGFLSYRGSLRINGFELRDLSPDSGVNSCHGSGKIRSFLPPRYAKTFCWLAPMPAKNNYKPHSTAHGSASFTAAAAGRGYASRRSGGPTFRRASAARCRCSRLTQSLSVTAAG